MSKWAAEGGVLVSETEAILSKDVPRYVESLEEEIFEMRRLFEQVLRGLASSLYERGLTLDELLAGQTVHGMPFSCPAWERRLRSELGITEKIDV